jgi:hypothetical protein
MRRRQDIWIFSAAVIFALGLAVPAGAANEGKHKKAETAASHATKHRRATALAQPAFRLQGGVPAGPLYNGQDYLGDDPDPNIRSQILRDMGSRYGGND